MLLIVFHLKIPDDDVLNICYEDMKLFLNIIRNIKLEKSDDAKKLLKSYYNTIKNDRIGKMLITSLYFNYKIYLLGALSVKGFQIIEQMSESFAKLSLRDMVLV